MSYYLVDIGSPSNNDFGAALEQWKQKSGWSDERIAEATGLHRTTVSAIRLGRNRPQWRTRVVLWDKLPGFRRFCKMHYPNVLERYKDDGSDELERADDER